MRTWDNNKDHVKAVDPEGKKNVEEIESLTTVIASIARNTPNSETLEAMTEAERIAHDPNANDFFNMESLTTDLDA